MSFCRVSHQYSHSKYLQLLPMGSESRWSPRWRKSARWGPARSSRQMRAVTGNTSARLNLLTGQQSPGLGQGRRKGRCQGRFLVNDERPDIPVPEFYYISFYFRACFLRSPVPRCGVGARPRLDGAARGRRCDRQKKKKKREQIGASGAPGSILIDSERGVSTFLNKVTLTWASLYAHPISIGLWERDLGCSHKINDRSMINGSISNPDC